MVKNLPAVQETWIQSLNWEDPLEKEMATHSSILACEITWSEEPGGHSPWSCKRVGHNLVTKQQIQDCSPPDSSVLGIFQARILEWVAMSFYRLQSTGYCLWGHRVGLDLVTEQ